MLHPLTLVLVGDILTGRGVAPLLKSPHNALWKNQSLIAGADLALGNLEAAPRTARTKRRPSFNPGDLAALRNAGFDGLSLANNHSLDAGEDGARQTQRELQRLGVKQAGLSFDGQNQIALWNIGGRRVALVSATRWGPFKVGKAQLQRLDLPFLEREISDLTAQNVFVIASLHWGTEGVSAISSEQREIAHRLIDAGAIVVWGHHPHVAGTIETWKDRPIFSSTGNFLWDRMPSPQSGLLARLSVEGQTPQSARVSWRTVALDPQVRLLKAPPAPRGERLVQSLPGHFWRDPTRTGWIVWTRDQRQRPVLRAMERSGSGWRILATGHPRFVAKIEIGDLNGDGRDELVVELHQRSKLDAQTKPRLHVYDLGERGFVPLWRGSMLSRPFSEWTLVGRRAAPGCDLAALERGQNGISWLSLYRWNGFGLRVVAGVSFQTRLEILKSGCDRNGPFVAFNSSQNNTKNPLRARAISGENSRELWRFDTRPASSSP